jgi:hypothetical protein
MDNPYAGSMEIGYISTQRNCQHRVGDCMRGIRRRFEKQGRSDTNKKVLPSLPSFLSIILNMLDKRKVIAYKLRAK